MSGLSGQEGLIVRACATSKDFEGVAKVLVEQYGQIHLREGSRSWTGRVPTSALPGRSSGKGPGKGKYTSSSGKGSYPGSAYTAGEDVDEQHRDEQWHDEQAWNEDESYTGLLGGIEDDPQATGEDDYDYFDDVDEYEAMALNCLLDVVDADEKQAGDAVQLQLAAHASFGKAKGKGKFGQKGKPGKGKLARSHLTIEQRRAKLADLKKRSWPLGWRTSMQVSWIKRP